MKKTKQKDFNYKVWMFVFFSAIVLSSINWSFASRLSIEEPILKGFLGLAIMIFSFIISLIVAGFVNWLHPKFFKTV